MIGKIFIRKERVKNIKHGHPWVFSQAIHHKEGARNGDLAEIYGDNEFIGIGYYNENTDIAVRIITHKKEEINESFFTKRFSLLKNQKENYIKNTNAYRIVFGESDKLPGLIVDKYDQTLVIQFHTLGMERLEKFIVPALITVFEPDCIYLKESLHSRNIERMEKSEAKTLYGKLKKEVIISENGFKFAVDIAAGQKTGFFLDQRANRKSIIPFVHGKKILNCFSYTGGFSVYAAKEAKMVASVDISKPAIEYAKKNFTLNHFPLDQHQFIAADVFDFLKQLKKEEYDVIILDPPSFARNRGQVTQAIKAYTTINSKALEKLPPGGILISSSCTAHIDELTFIKILHQSSVNVGCQLKVLHNALQPFDHPYNLHFPEGRYLKFFILLKD